MLNKKVQTLTNVILYIKKKSTAIRSTTIEKHVPSKKTEKGIFKKNL